jgi:hypothetical protein
VLTQQCASARRAFAGNTTKHPRRDASSARKHDIADCQYRRKRLHRRHFFNSRIQRKKRNRRHRDSPTPVENALRGL